MLIKIGSALIDPEEIAAIVPDMDETVPAYEKATHIRMDFRHGGSVWIDATMDEAEAAMIDAGVMTDLTDEPPQDEDTAPALSAFEIEELCKLCENGYRYMARDKDGKLYAFQHKPKYGGFYWDDPDLAPAMRVDGLSFVSEEDEEPTEICSILSDLS